MISVMFCAESAPHFQAAIIYLTERFGDRNMVLTGRHLEGLADLVTDQLNRWQASNHGDYEGALELLLALTDSHEGLKAMAEIGEARDYLRTRLSEIR